MIVDFRKQQREHPPIHIDGTAVEKVESFKFLGIHITDKKGATSRQPQGSPEGSAVCTKHHRGQTTCPPGHLQHPMS
jgi:hypothetical protein